MICFNTLIKIKAKYNIILKILKAHEKKQYTRVVNLLQII